VSGIDYLLDTNIILGLLKSSPETLVLIGQRQIEARQCSYSAITRMELLGFPGLTPEEEALIKRKLAQLTYQPITSTIEDEAIQLRRTHAIKLPDAIIAASALMLDAQLLTHDKKLQGVMALESLNQAGSQTAGN
jgi:predicted nucleic acid-binding protein